MTPEQIDNMQPGRELDALIAEHVFKLDAACWIHDCELTAHQIPAYSTDIAAAWQVVEKLREGRFICRFAANENGYVGGFANRATLQESVVIADAAPLAICKAALKVAASERPTLGQPAPHVINEMRPNLNAAINANQIQPPGLEPWHKQPEEHSYSRRVPGCANEPSPTGGYHCLQCRGALEPQQPEEQDKPLNRQLEELFYNRLTNRGKQVLANQVIDDLES